MERVQTPETEETPRENLAQEREKGEEPRPERQSLEGRKGKRGSPQDLGRAGERKTETGEVSPQKGSDTETGRG